MKVRIVAILLLAIIQVNCKSCNRPTVFPIALSFATDGYVDTDFDLTTISGRTHSMTFRFMLQFPNSYYNNILGESGGGSYSVLKNNVAPAFAVFIGGVFEAYPFLNAEVPTRPLEAKRWYHVAITID